MTEPHKFVPQASENALSYPAFRYLMAATVGASLASRALAVVIGFQIYQITRSPLALGWLGLWEAIPAVGLALFGGYFADQHDRKRILLITRGASVVCAVLFAVLSGSIETLGLSGLYALVFIAGIARGFGDPAASAFETQVVPMKAYINASTWLGSAWQACSIIGPALGGLAYDWLGAKGTYLMIAFLFLVSWVSIFMIRPTTAKVERVREPIGQSIKNGVKFVWNDKVLVGSMALDLFAVLFGGAVALLPVFANDILHVGAKGLGFLVAAPSVGALLVMLWATKRPPVENAGRTLLLCIAGFGVSIIVFALSKNFYLSLVALAFSGAFDGVSMVIRRAILRLRTPDHLRGRVASVSLLFIGSSNEIGAFESGIAAHLLGTVPAVWVGGMVTLLVVAATAATVPELRKLHLRPRPGTE
ncbi:MFS transporter [Deinococcus cellulosilyticus]|uniref:MFS transporter n=1 Tax=Deinococcus cellulosilyticus (strain DSM 18568 / NBRC 106333 / KACC 11606 / 5516J-15) TaxID=1223518 RepID=A0A511MX42_DEIC1|nr:MFS transporter [Deinococcus cellulosilyticus]GEM45152.1 MFS transporter [Deinococcus cellulosilyticus NBRC 106333 = KACC 11606]